MEPMEPYTTLLRQLPEHPLVTQATAPMREAIAALRFHEGLRRRWENARAEGAIREATALAILAGVRITVDDLRVLTMGQPGDELTPGEAVAVGVWRAQWNIASAFPALNSRQPQRTAAPLPLPALLSAWHRDVTSGLVASRHTTHDSVAIPQESGQLAVVMRTVQAAQRGQLSALCAAADVWARFTAHEIFTPGSQAVGATLARWLLVHRGVEPTGVATISAWHSLKAPESAEALAAWRHAQDPSHSEAERCDALAHWVSAFAQAITYGAQVGQDIALRVQAGRLHPTHEHSPAPEQ